MRIDRKEFSKDQIENINGQIIDKYKLERIILFEGTAIENFNEDSELDLLIIKKIHRIWGMNEQESSEN
jgi:predicted nucleotidyltransferase